MAIIELDDKTHNSEKDSKRDTMLASAGYRVVCWNSKSKPDGAAIRAELAPRPPAAPPLKSGALGNAPPRAPA